MYLFEYVPPSHVLVTPVALLIHEEINRMLLLQDLGYHPLILQHLVLRFVSFRFDDLRKLEE